MFLVQISNCNHLSLAICNYCVRVFVYDLGFWHYNLLKIAYTLGAELAWGYTSLLILCRICIPKVFGSVHQLSTSSFIFPPSISISHLWQILMGLFVAGNWSSCNPHLMHPIYYPPITTPFTVYIVMLICRWLDLHTDNYLWVVKLCFWSLIWRSDMGRF
jgi:hypothetical protein